MLSTLHDTIHDSHAPWWHIFPHSRPQFRFFVLHHLGRIRFFLETSAKHRQFLESQLYAHYSSIEITEATLPFDSTARVSVQEARLEHISGETIKLMQTSRIVQKKRVSIHFRVLLLFLQSQQKMKLLFFE